MYRENAMALCFPKLLRQRDTEFDSFRAALEGVMTQGLARLSPCLQFVISKKIEAGAELVAMVTRNPVSLTAALREKESTPIKLFELREQVQALLSEAVEPRGEGVMPNNKKNESGVHRNLQLFSRNSDL